jgi:hypothetical protein
METEESDKLTISKYSLNAPSQQLSLRESVNPASEFLFMLESNPELEQPEAQIKAEAEREFLMGQDDASTWDGELDAYAEQMSLTPI